MDILDFLYVRFVGSHASRATCKHTLKIERIYADANSVIKVIILNLLVYDRLANVMIMLNEINPNSEFSETLSQTFPRAFYVLLIDTSIGVICDKFTRTNRSPFLSIAMQLRD